MNVVDAGVVFAFIVATKSIYFRLIFLFLHLRLNVVDAGVVVAFVVAAVAVVAAAA